jgi:hypothetical protein
LLPILDLIIPPVPEGGGGYTVLRPSVLPKYFSSHFSQQLLMATIDDIWSQASHRYAISYSVRKSSIILGMKKLRSW